MGLARRRLGVDAGRRRRLARGASLAAILTLGVGGLFAGVALANELALRDRPVAGSRFGPTDAKLEPPPCDERVAAGRTARVDILLDGDIDGRPIGSISVGGVRSGSDYRWAAYVASRRQLGQFGGARTGRQVWALAPATGWRALEEPVVRRPAEDRAVGVAGLDASVVALALEPGRLPAAEVLGLAFFEGARARHCRVAIDGPTFRATFPQIEWLVGAAALDRWRGELDYWIFADGELGRAAGSVNGEAASIDSSGIQATLRVTLSATERGRDHRVIAPVP
jgi:hypothetical protein